MARSKRRPPVDWSKVPVVITGTPNPEAIRLIVESIREFEYREWLKKQAAADCQRPAGNDQVVADGSLILSSQA